MKKFKWSIYSLRARHCSSFYFDVCVERSPFRPVVFDRGASCRLQPDMATGGGEQVWTWKKRKTVAASRAARGRNEITTVSV